jgi:hypothetical protein
MVPVASSVAAPPVPVPVSTDPLDHWTTTSLNPGAGFAGGFTLPVASLNGTFFASGAPAGLNATGINTSTDGLAWAQTAIIRLPSATQIYPNAMAQLSFGYVGGTYVTGFANGAIETSKDGVHWTFANSTTNQGLASVACGSGTSTTGVLRQARPTCVFGSNGFVVTSTDDALQAWKLVGLPDQRYGVAGVAYGAGLFVAVTQTGCSGCGGANDTGAIFTSPDGLTWTQRATTSGLFSVTYGSRGFVGVGWQGTVVTSADGITWTSAQVPSTRAAGIELHGVGYGNGDYVAVGFIQGTPATPFLFTLTGRETAWASRAVSVPDARLYSVAFGADRFVVDGFSSSTTGPGHMVLTSNTLTAPLSAAGTTSATGTVTPR